MVDKLRGINWAGIASTLIASLLAAYAASWVAVEKAQAVQESRIATVVDQNKEIIKQLDIIRDRVDKVIESQAAVRERLARTEARSESRHAQ
jgi:peptidoglycan hydrolase CwlO-like protein